MGFSNAFQSDVAFYKLYGAYVNGRWEETNTAPVFKKASVQPLKEGEELTFTEAGEFYTNSYKVVYIKGDLTFPDLPDGADVTATVYFFDGDWYQVQGNQAWDTVGRINKHIRFLSSKYPEGSEPAITDPTFP